jgi:signal transduction histidine kinase
MNKVFFLMLIWILSYTATFEQDSYLDTLRQLVQTGKQDTLKATRLLMLGFYSIYSQPDSGIVYSKQALELSQTLHRPSDEALAFYEIGHNLCQLGDYANAIKFGLKTLSLFQNLNDQGGIIIATEALGTHYRDQRDYKQALHYLFKAKTLTEALSHNLSVGNFYPLNKERQLATQEAEIGFSYLTINTDSALFYARAATIQTGFSWLYSIVVVGDAYSRKGNLDSALHYFRLGLKLTQELYLNDAADNYIGLSNVFRRLGLNDSCIHYAKKGLKTSRRISYLSGIYEASGIIASVYENIDPKQSIKYYKLNKATNDSLFDQQKIREAQSFSFAEQLHQQELKQQLEQSTILHQQELKQQLEKTTIKNRNRLNVYALLVGLLILGIVSVGLWRRNIFKQRSFALLQEQKKETELQKEKAENTLADLKSTQSQLIQSEKMASLGEMAAGIAHEIQNPLNFVNNFSEVNKQLIEETGNAIDSGNQKEAKGLLSTLRQNQEKVSLHGQRADSIVKGMLQHSRISTGQKEPTNINALADEYLRLAYHGFRAKDKSFNAAMKTDFDQNIGSVNMVPQDIGRVLLNLFNNAFYSVSEKNKHALDGYDATVGVTTRKLNTKVVITVKDNGCGIPQKLIDKIFEPFFTTKPAGQGTGLGLSLSYDIAKAHGGQIEVHTKEGEYAEFQIELPI